VITLRRMRQQRGRTTPISQYIAAGWKQEVCPHCAGRGLAYGRRYEGGPISHMERCRACNGRGSSWRSPGGRRHATPGGPYLPSGD